MRRVTLLAFVVLLVNIKASPIPDGETGYPLRYPVWWQPSEKERSYWDPVIARLLWTHPALRRYYRELAGWDSSKDDAERPNLLAILNDYDEYDPFMSAAYREDNNAKHADRRERPMREEERLQEQNAVSNMETNIQSENGENIDDSERKSDKNSDVDFDTNVGSENVESIDDSERKSDENSDVDFETNVGSENAESIDDSERKSDKNSDVDFETNVGSENAESIDDSERKSDENSDVDFETNVGSENAESIDDSERKSDENSEVDFEKQNTADEGGTLDRKRRSVSSEKAETLKRILQKLTDLRSKLPTHDERQDSSDDEGNGIYLNVLDTIELDVDLQGLLTQLGEILEEVLDSLANLLSDVNGVLSGLLRNNALSGPSGAVDKLTGPLLNGLTGKRNARNRMVGVVEPKTLSKVKQNRHPLEGLGLRHVRSADSDCSTQQTTNDDDGDSSLVNAEVLTGDEPLFVLRKKRSMNSKPEAGRYY